jgi:hypothetical protein
VGYQCPLDVCSKPIGLSHLDSRKTHWQACVPDSQDVRKERGMELSQHQCSCTHWPINAYRGERLNRGEYKYVKPKNWANFEKSHRNETKVSIHRYHGKRSDLERPWLYWEKKCVDMVPTFCSKLYPHGVAQSLTSMKIRTIRKWPLRCHVVLDYVKFFWWSGKRENRK